VRVTSWADHAVLWHVYPLGFTGAERAALPAHEPARHRLGQFEPWLDYAVELGCNGLLLGPVFAAETHGYDTTEHFRFDPRLGDEADFDALVSAADQRGLRLVLDGVFNHVGRSFPAFRAALAGGPSAPAARWFKRTPDGGDFAVFEGHGQLVELDHDEPAVLSYVVEVMTHWLGRGAAGWRLDAAYAVPPAFWAKAVSAVRETFPGAWFLGEMIHGDYAAYASEAGLDSITQYEVWKAVWSSLNDRNLYELDHALGRHNAFMDGELAQTFVGNHDVTRLATALSDERHFSHAIAILFCVGGVPSVYYGDEQGFRGLKEQREGGDDAIRPAFPASPAELLPDGWRHYRLHQRLIGFRRRHPWLVRARTRPEQLHASTMALRIHGASPGEQVLLLLNVGDEPHQFDVDAGGLSVAEAAETGAVGADPLLVAAHCWTILALPRLWRAPRPQGARPAARNRGCRRSGSPGRGHVSRSWRRSGSRGSSPSPR
jgi:cyclomaltodextrinase / maltogenic alpha-amylase / neopullulanase